MAATNSIDALFAPPPAPTAPRGGDQASRAPGGERFEPSLARALQAKPAERRPLATEKPEAEERDEASTADRAEPPVARKTDSAVKDSPTDCPDCDAPASDAEAAAGENADVDESSDDSEDSLATIQQAVSTQDSVPVAGGVPPIPTAAIVEVLAESAADGSVVPATTTGSSDELPSDAQAQNSATSAPPQAPAAEPVAELNAALVSQGLTDAPAAASPGTQPTAESSADTSVVVAPAADGTASASSSSEVRLADPDGSEAAHGTARSSAGDLPETAPAHGSEADGETDQVQASSAPAPLDSAAKSGLDARKQASPTASTDTQESAAAEPVRRSDKKSLADQPKPESAPASPALVAQPLETPAVDSASVPAAPVGPVTAAAGTSRGATTIERLGNAQFSAEPTQRSEHDGEPTVDRNRFLQRVEGAFKAAQQRDGRIHVRLSPPELGALRIELIMQNGALTARIEAETPAARATLLDNLPALRERLAQQEIRIEKFDVDVRRDGGSDGGSTGQQSRDGQADQSSWRDNGGRQRNQSPRPQAAAAPQHATPGTRVNNSNGALDVRI